jgi:hypothetical protein
MLRHYRLFFIAEEFVEIVRRSAGRRFLLSCFPREDIYLFKP